VTRDQLGEVIIIVGRTVDVVRKVGLSETNEQYDTIQKLRMYVEIHNPAEFGIKGRFKRED
jgi:hypothetical protein